MSRLLLILTGFFNLLFPQPVHQSPSIIDNSPYLVFEQKTTPTANGKYQVDLRILDQQNRPVNGCSLSIYNQENAYYPEYPFSILKTGEAGRTTFTLPKGKFLLIASSEENTENSTFFLINYQLNIPSDATDKVYNIKLTKNHVSFRNGTNTTPFKLEGSLQTSSTTATPNQAFANNLHNLSEIIFYTSPGVYNFNLDQKEFSAIKNTTYALSRFSFNSPEEVEVAFDMQQLKTSTVDIKGIKYGWFKLIADGIGDFQSMYFGKPVTIKTNTDKLFLEMVYIPDQKCTQSKIDKKKDPKDAITGCTNTDIRFDYTIDPKEVTYLLPNKQLDILPPDKLEINLSNTNIKQDDVIVVNYNLSNSANQKINRVFIHQLWDQDIAPNISFVNSKGEVVYQQRYNSQKPDKYFQVKPCLTPGKYQLKANFPVLLWGNTQIFESRQDINITTGSLICQPLTQKNIDPSHDYSNWEELYQDRQALYLQSSGYLQTFPRFGSSPAQVNIDRNNYVNQCSDLNNINNSLPIIIDLDQKNTFDQDNSQKFKACLQEYVSKNNQRVFLLRNSFTDDAFASRKSYVFYYYYLLLHQGKANQVGIIADIFYDIFYGFPEFYLVSSELQDNFLNKETFQQVVKDYQPIIDPQIIFYQ